MASNLYSHKDSNIRKTWFLITVFLLVVIGFGWALSYVLEMPIVLPIAIGISVLMSFGSYWWSDKLVLKMTNAQELKKEELPEVYNIVENLSIASGLPMPRLYIVNEEAPNAFATGRNPDNAVIGVTKGLLKRLDRSELEGVLAHEMSHIGNRDMLVSTVVVVLAGSIIYATDIVFRMLLFGGGNRNSNQGGAVVLVIGIAAMILAPLLATVLRTAVSRKREFLADSSGALMTRYPEGLASALEKISQDPTPMRSANNATAHLFFENPFHGDKKQLKSADNRPNFFTRLFMTHPPVEDRIAALRGKK